MLPFWIGKEQEWIMRHCDFCFWKEYTLYFKKNKCILASQQSVTLGNYLCVLWSHLNESLRLEKHSPIRKDGYFPVKKPIDWVLFDIAVCTTSRIRSIHFSLWPDFQKEKKIKVKRWLDIFMSNAGVSASRKGDFSCVYTRDIEDSFT